MSLLVEVIEFMLHLLKGDLHDLEIHHLVKRKQFPYDFCYKVKKIQRFFKGSTKIILFKNQWFLRTLKY
jgi:hypothetical protein